MRRILVSSFVTSALVAACNSFAGDGTPTEPRVEAGIPDATGDASPEDGPTSDGGERTDAQEAGPAVPEVLQVAKASGGAPKLQFASPVQTGSTVIVAIAVKGAIGGFAPTFDDDANDDLYLPVEIPPAPVTDCGCTAGVWSKKTGAGATIISILGSSGTADAWAIEVRGLDPAIEPSGIYSTLDQGAKLAAPSLPVNFPRALVLSTVCSCAKVNKFSATDFVDLGVQSGNGAAYRRTSVPNNYGATWVSSSTSAGCVAQTVAFAAAP